MEALAVVLEKPRQIALRDLTLDEAGAEDILVDVEWSGISTGTEKLLWSGAMPDFPGMGYPLVPGYETVGRVARAPRGLARVEGERVFVPGASCFGPVRGLFGGAASRLVVPARRAVPVPQSIGGEAVLFALAATAHHAVSPDTRKAPQLVVGHGVLGRLIARLVVAAGGEPPTVWENDPARRGGAEDYEVTTAEDDPRRDYHRICDVSGSAGILDQLVARLAHGGEIVLAGFYDQRLSFAFPPAFTREARLRIAAEFRPADLVAVGEMVAGGRLSLDGLITHSARPDGVEEAYRTAFTAASCLKMVIDWRHDS